MKSMPAVNRTQNQREKCSFLKREAYWYLHGIFKKGYDGKLTSDDFFKVASDMSTETTWNIIDTRWKEQLKKTNPSLFLALVKTHWRKFLVALTLITIEESVRLAIPLFVGWLVSYFSVGSDVSSTNAYLYAMGISLCTFLAVVVHHPYFFQVLIIGLRMRSSTAALVYHKILRLSSSALMSTSTGQMVNLVSTDVERVQNMVMFASYLFLAPVMLIIGIVIMWQVIGCACLAGFGILLVLMPSQGILSRLFVKFRTKIIKLTDERVKIMSELISGMRVIKMYGWEQSFAKAIKNLRKRETAKVALVANIRATNVALMLTIPYLAGLATFLIVYYLTDDKLTPTKVFTVMTMFQQLRVSIMIFFPNSVQQVSEGFVSLRRIQKFLLMDEMSSESVNHTNDPSRKSHVKCNGVCARWSESGEPTLRDVSVEVSQEFPLLMIAGPVGAGKTSILLAILKELPIYEGNIITNGKIAYAPQLPWIYSGTVKENILFGQEFNSAKYHKVLEVCSLVEDISQFYAGDGTLVGERGVSLSGGQKARISLARAIYHDADIYILDDPLSAVDTKVGKVLFEKCINGYLSNKLCILVTHQIQYLRHASNVTLMKDVLLSVGQVVGQGTYSDLEEQGFDLISLVSHDPSTKSPDADSAIDSDLHTLQQHNYERHSSHAYSVTSASYMRSLSFCSSHSAIDPDVDEDIIFKEQDILSDPLLKSPEKNKTKENVEIMNETEDVQRGQISAKLYVKYFMAGAGFVGTILLILLGILGQLSVFSIDIWLSIWATGELEFHNPTNTTIRYYNTEDRNMNVYIFIALTFGAILICIIRSITFFNVFINASRILHDRMMKAVLAAPVYFFDSNPVGRILNRFSKDIYFLDDELPWTFFDFIYLMFISINILLVNVYNVPYLLVVVLPLLIVLGILRRYFVRTSRDVKRIEAISRGPLYSHVSATIQGLSCIRAYQYEQEAINQMYDCQDHQTEGVFLFLECSRWFGQRLDSMTAVFVSCACFAPIVLTSYTDLDRSLVGVSIMYTITLSGLFQWAVRQSSQVENLMTSAERVVEYSQIKPEPDHPTSVELPSNWPRFGLITAEKASFTYHESLPPVLKNLYFCLRANEKVGIVGRTGAGKSSLLSMLFRMAHSSGCLRIDGIDVQDLSLLDLRKRISVIPQDPVLFSGSLRYNLDPFDDYADSDIWDALDEVQLRDLVLELPHQLYSELAEAGSNFSVGQRQLLCLGRAILRKNKILVIDEGTANVDMATDKLIQGTLREKFKDCTVLTVAHRLNTIMDSDRIMMEWSRGNCIVNSFDSLLRIDSRRPSVMNLLKLVRSFTDEVLDAGKIVQFDEPLELLSQEDGVFKKLVNQTGRIESSRLEQIARFSAAERRDELARNPQSYPGSDIRFSRSKEELLTMFDTHVFYETSL